MSATLRETVHRPFSSLSSSVSALLEIRRAYLKLDAGADAKQQDGQQHKAAFLQRYGTCLGDCDAMSKVPPDDVAAAVELIVTCSSHCKDAASEMSELVEYNEDRQGYEGGGDDDDDDDDDECMRLDATEFEVAKACSGLVDSAVGVMDSIVRTVWATRTASPREDARRELDRACGACKKIRVSTEDLVASCYSPMERGAIIEAATAMAGAAADARRACRRRRGSCGGGGDGDDRALDALIAAADAVARQTPEGTGV